QESVVEAACALQINEHTRPTAGRPGRERLGEDVLDPVAADRGETLRLLPQLVGGLVRLRARDHLLVTDALVGLRHLMLLFEVEPFAPRPAAAAAAMPTGFSRSYL